jgi:formimidoylglutamate deiminase
MLLSAKCVVYRGQVHRQMGIEVDAQGMIVEVAPLRDLGAVDLYLPERLLVPGTVSSHGDGLQRLLRGREPTPPADSADLAAQARCIDRANYLWTSLTPSQVQAVAEQVFVEMLLAGVTTAGEVFLLQKAAPAPGTGRRLDPSASPYAMADAWLAAAQRTGMRLSLIYTVALRGAAQPAQPPLPAHLGCRSLDVACDRFDGLIDHILARRDPRLSWAVGVHGLGALPLDALIGLKVRLAHMPLHVPVSRHPAELETSRLLHAQTPIQLLVDSGICDACVSLVDGTYQQPGEAAALARTGAQVAYGPPGGRPDELQRQAATAFTTAKLPQSLSYDARAGGSLFGVAQQLGHQQGSLAQPGALLASAGQNGGTALGVPTGQIAPGYWADLVALDLGAPSLAGLSDSLLLPALAFDVSHPPILEVFVAGELVVRDGQHPAAASIQQAYARCVDQVFGEGPTGGTA